MNLDAIAKRALVIDGEFIPTNGQAYYRGTQVAAVISLENGCRLLISLDTDTGDAIVFLQRDMSTPETRDIQGARVEEGVVVISEEPTYEVIRDVGDLKLAMLMYGSMAFG